MKITVADVENSVTHKEKDKIDVTPYNPRNKLVSCGWATVEGDKVVNPQYGFFYHNDLPEDYPVQAKRDELQAVLDETDILIGHNMKHDLAWLLESGFSYSGKVYDTKIGEYVLLRGQKWSTELDHCAKRRECSRKRTDLTKDYLKKGIGFEAMPMEVVEEYGVGDVITTGELYLKHQKLYAEDRNSGLVKTRDMMNEFLIVLTDMERNGIAIDRVALNEVKEQYQQEKKELEQELYDLTFQVMGDTPINLNSPEQLSQVIYSRKLTDKAGWTKTFNVGLDDRGRPKRRPNMSKSEFIRNVRKYTEVVKRTKAYQCPDCKGTGKIRKLKKDGTPYKKENHCNRCRVNNKGTGLLYKNLDKIAGFKLTPSGPQDVSIGGFATGKEKVERLIKVAQDKGNEKAIKFLKAMSRLNAVNTYLDSFVGGIERGVQDNNILHARFNQTVAATGRLSSSDPNFQNQPRGKTFPVRKVVVSRFRGGSIMEADYSQLEFRCAGILSGDPNIKRDVLDGVDAHQFTADTMTEAGQPTDRQAAKPHTFKPLYGGMSGTEAEKTYYKAFLTERYPRTGEWHKELIEEAISTKMVTLPTGRQYHLPAERTSWGSTLQTQIKNYPVQGFATADIVPIANIRLYYLMKKYKVKSLHVNTVHDSIVIDVFPGEEKIMCKILLKAMLGVVDDLKSRYNIVLSIPLAVEVKVGPNWLEGEEVAEGDTEGNFDVDKEYFERIAA